MNLEDLVKSLAWGTGYDVGTRLRYLRQCRQRGWDHSSEKARYHDALSAARWFSEKARQYGSWELIQESLKRGIKDGRRAL